MVIPTSSFIERGSRSTDLQNISKRLCFAFIPKFIIDHEKTINQFYKVGNHVKLNWPEFII